MPSPAQEHDAIMAAASRSLADQRAGGRRVTGPAIGVHSRALRRRAAAQRLARMGLSVVAVLLAAMIAGLAIGGIGFTGIMLTALALAVVGVLTLRYPSLRVPMREGLARGDLHRLVGNTQLWLEAQRPALPVPAARLIDQIGSQLDTLNLQLAGLDDSQPAAADIRRLVGDHLPEVVSAYTSIPRTLRAEARAGTSPDTQIATSLTQISAEIDSVTRQLADGALDRLAIQTRYLDTRYGGGMAAVAPALAPPQPVDGTGKAP